jgi:hypothetical protein
MQKLTFLRIKSVNSFPKIDDLTSEFVCKISQARIEDEEGHFYGSVSKQTGMPSGLGVFVSDTWIHCGEFQGKYFAKCGKTVSLQK